MTEYSDDRLRERFGALADSLDDADWANVVRRARRGHRRRIVALVAVAALLVAAAASAAYTLTRAPTPGMGRVTLPEGPETAADVLFPGGSLERVKSVLARFGKGELAFAPTRAPAHYVGEGEGASDTEMGLILTDERFRGSFAEIGKHSLTFKSELWDGSASECGTGGTDTFDVGGTDVHWDGKTAWRCVVLKSGRIARLSATAETNVPAIPPAQGSRVVSSHLPAAALADVVASARPF